jgi:hypothetical protein
LEQVTAKTPAVCPVPARLTFYTNCAMAPTRADVFCLLSCNTRREESHNISGDTKEGIKVALLKQTLGILKVSAQNAAGIIPLSPS